jgi:FAD:protein FMN transferase
MRSPLNKVRRCRPLLGTLVEITVAAQSESLAIGAMETAFDAIQRVQSLMSFHAAESDISHLNRSARSQIVEVNSWTYEVLLAAAKLHRDSKGIFDITIAPQLEHWRYLPRQCRNRFRQPCAGNQSSIELLPGNRVRFHQPVRIDLGGIAKGFAVDKAVEALKTFGVSSALVNAGGDLRVFGLIPSTIHVRHPSAPTQTLPLLQLSEGAFATSAGYFTRKKFRGRWVSPLINPVQNRPCTQSISASVQAPTCMLADALTKVLMIRQKDCAELLKSNSATGWIITSSGKVSATDS